MRVTRLSTYAVKSLAGVTQAEATVTPIGLEHDRRWVLVDAGDEGGRPVTARECPALLGVRAVGRADGGLVLEHAGDRLEVDRPGPGAERVRVGLSRVDELAAADPAAGTWLGERVGRGLRLLHLDDPAAREIGARHGGRPGETMNLSDAGPLLLCTDASVARLRDWVLESSQEEWVDHAEAVERFRPNLVVDGEEPFAEDTWARIRVGATTYRRGELCDRCMMPTIDLTDLVATREPTRTLARHRRWDGTTWFGVRFVPELGQGATASVTVGDEVVVLDRSAPRGT